MSGVEVPTKPMTEGSLQPFSIAGTPLLNQGSSMALVTRAPAIWMHIKVYNDGGENGVHCHPFEDHIFFVLQGQATFSDANGAMTVVGPNEGMTVPRGALYSFLASSDENLVMLRIGAAVDEQYARDLAPGAPAGVAVRHHPDGRPFAGEDNDNKTGAQRGVRSGAFFGDRP